MYISRSKSLSGIPAYVRKIHPCVYEPSVGRSKVLLGRSEYVPRVHPCLYNRALEDKYLLEYLLTYAEYIHAPIIQHGRLWYLNLFYSRKISSISTKTLTTMCANHQTGNFHFKINISYERKNSQLCVRMNDPNS